MASNPRFSTDLEGMMQEGLENGGNPNDPTKRIHGRWPQGPARTQGNHEFVIAIDFGTTRSACSIGVIPPGVHPSSVRTEVRAADEPHGTNRGKTWTQLAMNIGSRGERLQQAVSSILKTQEADHDLVRFGETGYKNLNAKLFSDKLEKQQGCSSWFYASDFKMLLDIKTRQEQGEASVRLHDTKVPLRQVKEAGGETVECPLLDVIAVYLHVVGMSAFEQLQQICSDRGHLQQAGFQMPTSPSHVTWVVTIPAIWKDQARVFMREAVIKANLVDDDKLTRRIKLCLEPEAAALDCFREFVLDRQEAVVKKGDKWMIVDLGGGTADITVMDVASFNQRSGRVEFREVAPPSGGPWGGRRINAAFEDEVVHPLLGKNFEQYKGSFSRCDHMDAFEEQKQAFVGKSGDETYPIDVRDLFSEYGVDTGHLRSVLENLNAMPETCGYSTVRSKLQLDDTAMKRHFEASLSPLLPHLHSLLQEHGDKLKFVCLVGGLGANRYVKRMIEEHIQVPLLQPQDAANSIVRGAAAFGYLTNPFGQRIARANYGLALHNLEDPTNNLFGLIVEKGKNLKDVQKQLDHEPRGPYSPVTQAQTSVTVEIYESDEVVKFVTDGKASFIASTCIPVDTGLPFEERRYLVKVQVDGPVLKAVVISPDGSERIIEWATR